MRAIRRVLQVVAFVGTLMVGVAGARADRVADAVVSGLAAALHRARVEAVPERRADDRRYRRQPAVRRRSRERRRGRVGRARRRGEGGRARLQRVHLSSRRASSLDQIKIDQPVLQVERDANGWNLARLVKRQQQEADREGPTRPVSLPSIEITDASVSIEDSTPAGVSLPRRLDDLDVKAGFEYAPVHYSVNLDHVSFRGSSPDLSLQQLTGKLAVRDDNLYLEQVTLKTSETSLTVDGVIEQYLSTPVVKLTTTGNVSLPEIGRIVPAAAGYQPASGNQREGEWSGRTAGAATSTSSRKRATSAGS